MYECSNGKCIDLRRRCDGVNDCGDWSDEICGCRDYCSDGLLCRDNFCVSNKADGACDGVADCSDGSDEVDCIDDTNEYVSQACRSALSMATQGIYFSKKLSCL